MNNADQPAMPLTGEAYQDFAAYDGTTKTSYNPECQGLTKREHFAGLAMHGLLASDIEGNLSHNKCAQYAVEQADALLAELEQKQCT